MEQDKRYDTIKKLLDAGHIQQFSDIAEYIAPSAVARHLGIHYDRFKKLLKDPGGWTINELYTLGKLIGVNGRKITDLVNNQIEAKGKSGKV